MESQDSFVPFETNTSRNDDKLDVRLDKWLWAARFYKTRTLARQAIECGKVHYNHSRARPSQSVELDAVITLQLGSYQKSMVVTGLSKQRRSADDAAALYCETQESVQQNHARTEHRHYSQGGGGQDPDKHDRRRARFLRRGMRSKQSDEDQPQFEQDTNWNR